MPRHRQLCGDNQRERWVAGEWRRQKGVKNGDKETLPGATGAQHSEQTVRCCVVLLKPVWFGEPMSPQ